ncbi:hypothetical protein EDC65_2951 [Stella humosa]|uniref:Nucleic acid-binding Zn ribbon protein n=1 Tax=Stella humosa TaxID=94 RepID=A0A3N1LK23_9PROT|nr:DUF721 domain-containing protein [Stella humosa]ROP91089.1 hypothetical protein EDC65_2951 [Stella humosa]BBK34561.1 hypothetical protein STHU_51950 [Stella humosa]
MTKDTRSAAGLAPVGRMVPQLARTVFARYGFAVAAILTEWPTIVGLPLANHTAPERLVFPTGQRRDGTLHLRVESAWALEVQHLSHRIVERINAHFGFRAVARMTLRHGPMPPRPAPPVPPPAVEPGPAIEGGPSPTLNAALTDLGAAMRRQAAIEQAATERAANARSAKGGRR